MLPSSGFSRLGAFTPPLRQIDFSEFQNSSLLASGNLTSGVQKVGFLHSENLFSGVQETLSGGGGGKGSGHIFG